MSDEINERDAIRTALAIVRGYRDDPEDTSAFAESMRLLRKALRTRQAPRASARGAAHGGSGGSAIPRPPEAS